MTTPGGRRLTETDPEYVTFLEKLAAAKGECDKLRIRYESYKNFLGLHIGREGVTVYPIGIDQPGKEWNVVTQSGSPEDSYLAPASGSIVTHLIEPPFTV